MPSWGIVGAPNGTFRMQGAASQPLAPRPGQLTCGFARLVCGLRRRWPTFRSTSTAPRARFLLFVFRNVGHRRARKHQKRPTRKLSHDSRKRPATLCSYFFRSFRVATRQRPARIGSLLPANGPVAGGTSVTLRGSGFQSGTTLTLGGKAVSVVFKDMNTLTFTTPSLAAGAQQLVVTNPNGESVALDAAFIAN